MVTEAVNHVAQETCIDHLIMPSLENLPETGSIGDMPLNAPGSPDARKARPLRIVRRYEG